jgi:hypothetical protein
MMKRLLIALVLLAIPTGVALAEHSWATYHWPDDKLSPSVKDRTSDSLYDVPVEVAEWAGLGTPIQPGMADKKGEITVKEASNIFWLGLARIFIDDAGHITKGEVQLNTRLLAGYPNAKDATEHVLCQELGHVLGLDHQRGSDSCMDDTAPLGSVTSPNGHDKVELKSIYSHDDAPTGDDGGGGGPPCSKNPNHPNCRPSGRSSGRWVTVDVFPIPDDD